MDVVGDLYLWTDRVIFFLLSALRLWALVDCATRKTAAFPAVDKLTKWAWLLILLGGGLLGTFLGSPSAVPGFFSGVVGAFSLISAAVAAVYLADVRPAVREISGGR